MIAADIPELSVPEIEHGDDFVLGFPFHVAITLRLEASAGVESLMASLAEESVFGIRSTRASFQRLDAAGEPPLSVGPLRMYREKEGTMLLRAGERRRMLLDLSDLDVSSLRPGRYRISIEYEGLQTRPFEAQLREPSSDERASLARLLPDLARARTWGIWSKTRPVAGGASTPHILRTDPLRYNRVLQYLFLASEPLSQIPVSLLACLDGFYAPEAQLLRAELALAGNDGTFDVEERRLRADHPELVHLLERSIEHGSLYEWERRIRDRLGI